MTLSIIVSAVPMLISVAHVRVVHTKLSIVHKVDHKLIVYVNITGVHQALQNYIDRAFSLLLFIA